MNTSSKPASVASDRLSFALAALFLPPFAVMMGAHVLGWHWGYWESFWIENAVFLPLHYFGVGIVRAYNRGEGKS